MPKSRAGVEGSRVPGWWLREEEEGRDTTRLEQAGGRGHRRVLGAGRCWDVVLSSVIPVRRSRARLQGASGASCLLTCQHRVIAQPPVSEAADRRGYSPSPGSLGSGGQECRVLQLPPASTSAAAGHDVQSWSWV